MENNNAGWIEKLIQALDEERQKVEVFGRELPLSLHLINQTIESYKQLMATNMNNPSRQQELAAKELISLRPSSMSSSEEDTTKQLDREEISGSSNRMRPTLQFFAQDQQDHPLSPAMIGGLDSNSQDNFEKGEHVISIAPVTSEDVGTANGGEGNDDDGGDDTGSDGEENLKKNQKPHSKRKVRRYWSEELQKRFLLALEQLGGCHAATPRRIQKLMKVEGLTNAEIKSHLQKFRIRKKRTNPTLESRIPSINSNNNNEDNNFEAANFAVVVRGIWIPTVDSETGKFPQLVPLNSPLMLGNENFQNATKHARR